MTNAVVFDALGTLLDLGRAGRSSELARTHHHATALSLADEFTPLSQIARAVGEKLAERMSKGAIREEPARLAFVSAHGWDILGASKAGFHAVWVEHESWCLPLPPPELRAPSLHEAALLIVATRR
jgi:hypothetical protein